MGIWGSKQERDLTVSNGGDNFLTITDKAVNNILETNEQNNGDKNAPKAGTEAASNPSKESHLFSEDLEKRVFEYEHNLKENFHKATKEVEELFRNRYQTLPVCFDSQVKVHKCYDDHGKESPLNCSEVSKEYMRCVEEERRRRTDFNKTKQ
jgi:hypothetical protein